MQEERYRKIKTEKTIMAVFNEGSILEFKKKHPCGGNTWKVLRVGSDCRLQCETCGHQIEITRSKLEKNIKNLPNT